MEQIRRIASTKEVAGLTVENEKYLEAMVSDSQGRPWQLNKNHQRQEKLDRMASDIIANETL